MAVQNPQQGGHAESATCELRREEGLEDSTLSLLVHTTAGVLDLEHDVHAGQHFFGLGIHQRSGKAPKELLIAGDGAGGDGDRAGVTANGFGCVDDQVHYDLPDLRRVALEHGLPAYLIVLDQDALRDGDRQQLDHLQNQLGQVQGLDHEFATAGEGQHLGGESGGTLGSPLDLLEMRSDLGSGRQVQEG